MGSLKSEMMKFVCLQCNNRLVGTLCVGAKRLVEWLVSGFIVYDFTVWGEGNEVLRDVSFPAVWKLLH